MKAVGEPFGSDRATEEPLYVLVTLAFRIALAFICICLLPIEGSVESNPRHLGCSVLAGIVKSIMTIEGRIIVRNALLEKVNLIIDHELLKCSVHGVPALHIPVVV